MGKERRRGGALSSKSLCFIVVLNAYGLNLALLRVCLSGGENLLQSGQTVVGARGSDARLCKHSFLYVTLSLTLFQKDWTRSKIHTNKEGVLKWARPGGEGRLWDAFLIFSSSLSNSQSNMRCVLQKVTSGSVTGKSLQKFWQMLSWIRSIHWGEDKAKAVWRAETRTNAPSLENFTWRPQ